MIRFPPSQPGLSITRTALGTAKTRTSCPTGSSRHSRVTCTLPIAHLLGAFLPTEARQYGVVREPSESGAKLTSKDFCQIRSIKGISSSWERGQGKPWHCRAERTRVAGDGEAGAGDEHTQHRQPRRWLPALLCAPGTFVCLVQPMDFLNTVFKCIKIEHTD